MALIFTGLKRNKGPEMIQSSNVLYLLVVLLINIKVSFATSKYTFTHTDDSPMNLLYNFDYFQIKNISEQMLSNFP